MRIIPFSIIVIALLSLTFTLTSAQGLNASVLFMKSNSIAKVYANFTFISPNNKTWNLHPGIYAMANGIQIDSKNMTIMAAPSFFTGNINHVTVTYTITAKNNIQGVYGLQLGFCGLFPIVVGLNESEVPAIYDKFFTATYSCPEAGEIPVMNIVDYSNIIFKTISINSNNTNTLDQLGTTQVPEFQFAIPVLLTGVMVAIIFYRLKLTHKNFLNC